MRKGQNPARIGMPAYSPRQLGVASLVYIPHQEGYFAQSFEILKAQLASLRENTESEFDLLVLDNGSCGAVKAGLQQLQAEGWIDWLILSRYNLGKTGALNWILGAMPNEIIGYCDSDIFFRKGWFNESMKVLEAFPQAAFVTAQPNFFDVFRGEGKAHLDLSPVEYELSDFKPGANVVDEYCRGIGASEELVEKYRKQSLVLVSNKKSGVQAVLGANHMQFIGRCSVLRQVLPLSATKGLSPEEDRQFDLGLNRRGYVHLATPESYVYHIGNSMDDYILPEIKQLKRMDGSIFSSSEMRKPKTFTFKLLASLAKNRVFGSLVKRLYNGLFQIYSEGSG